MESDVQEVQTLPLSFQSNLFGVLACSFIGLNSECGGTINS